MFLEAPGPDRAPTQEADPGVVPIAARPTISPSRDPPARSARYALTLCQMRLPETALQQAQEDRGRRLAATTKWATLLIRIPHHLLQGKVLTKNSHVKKTFF